MCGIAGLFLNSRMVDAAVHSDCETILHAYRHYGAAFLDKLHGMFAFTLYGRRAGKLLLVRDRLGIKPLFFTQTPDGLCFASEQKALFPVLPGGPKINPKAPVQSLETGFNTGKETIATGVERLQAGEVAVVEQGRLSSRRRYWPPFGLCLTRMDYAQAAERFEALMMAQTMTEHMRSDVPFAVWAADDFIIDPAILPTSLLARETAKGFKVVFSGGGGDELFVGHGRYRRSKLQRWLANPRSPGSGGFRTRGKLGGTWRKRLLSPALRGQLAAARQGFIDAWQAAPSDWSDLQKMQHTDISTELADQLLVKVDRMLMAWGLEGRVPLLDHRLAEFALALPDNLKVRGREGKHFPKRWAAPLAGESTVYRPKRGFSVPLRACLAGENLKRLSQVLPRHPAFEGLFDPDGIAQLIARQSARADVSRALWALLQFAVWHRVFIQGHGEQPPVFADPIELISAGSPT